MAGARARKRALAMLALLIGAGGSCGGGSAECGNQREIWLQRVQTQCAACRAFQFETPISRSDTFLLGTSPDWVLGRCDVEEVQLHRDAVTLVLSAGAYRRLERAREAWDADAESLVALRFPGAAALIAVQHAADLGRLLTLFDLDTAVEAADFAAELGPDARIVETGRPLRGPGAGEVESPAARNARALLREDLSLPTLPDPRPAYGESHGGL